MNASPMVSVIMPAYNAEAFIAASINAMLGQTLTDFELIVIDDASTDRTVDVVEDLVRRDPRVKLLRNETNLGLVGAPNRGLDVARGTYIARHDADDLCPKNKLAVQVAYLEAHPDVAAVGAWGTKFGETTGLIKGPVSAEDIELRLIFDMSLIGASIVMRRSWLEEKKIRYRSDGAYAEDYDLWVQISEAGGAIANLPEVLLYYRVHGRSVTGSRYAYQQRAAMKVRYRQWERRGCHLSAEEKALLEGSVNGRSLSNDELATCRSILAKLEAMNLRATRWKIHFELGRFFCALLAGNFSPEGSTTNGMRDKLKVAFTLWRIKPTLPLFFIPLYLARRL